MALINKFEEFDYNAKKKTCLPPMKYERNVGLWHLGKYVFKSPDLINCLIYGRNVGQWNFGSRSNQSSLDCLGSLIMVDGWPNNAFACLSPLGLERIGRLWNFGK